MKTDRRTGFRKLSYDLPLLRATGNRIVDSGTGRPVRLRGVNRSGLEYTALRPSFLDAVGITHLEMDEIANWGANIVRLPFTQSRSLTTLTYTADAYLDALDQVIGMAAQRGIYTLLDLQWLDDVYPRGHLQNGAPNYVPPLPNHGSLSLWSRLAARYCDEPAVLFDIFNEPHDPLPGDPKLLYGIAREGSLFEVARNRVNATVWHPWARHLLSIIRSKHPDALVFISGLDWGYDLEHFPLAGIEGVVYSSHVYPQKKKSWDRAFGKLSRTHPVFIGEWGGREENLDWGRKLIDYLDERFLGWTAWSWADQPHLLEPGPGYRPTPFGALVQSTLREKANTWQHT